MADISVKLSKYNLVLTGVSSCLSIIGGMIIIVTFINIQEIRRYFTRKLLVYLTVADLFTAIGNLSAVIRYTYAHDGKETVAENCTANKTTDYENWCISQSFLTTFSNLASFLWTAVIAIHLWSSVMIRTRQTETDCLLILYHVICWIIPLTIVTILVNKGYLGEDFCYGTGVWCGIKSGLEPKTREKWMYIADIGWQIACYLTTCLLYIHLKFYLKIRHNGKQLSSIISTLRNEDENFVFMWMVIYLLKLWGFFRFFVMTYVDNDILHRESMQNFLEFLLMMQSYGASGQAFWNFILFCVLDQSVRKYMKMWVA